MALVAVDVMGGDGAPDVELDGMVAALRQSAGSGVHHDALRLVAVGDEARIRAGLAQRRAEDLGIRVVHAAQVVGMDDAPSSVVRGKTDSSMRVCFDLVKRGEAQAVVSAGNSGAMLACGLFVMGRIPWVDRPGIVTSFPTRRGHCAILDVGANVDPKGETLAQLAALGVVYARLLYGAERPRVGVLSNGSEDHKGSELTREVDRLLRVAFASEGDARYLGYVEGSDLFTGDVDVVVTDGFTGNVVLKACEGAAESIAALLKREVQRRWMARLGALLMLPAFRALRRYVDYAEQGGAPLLGVRGVAIVCHGRSNAKAIKNAIGVADRFVQLGLEPQLATAIQRYRAAGSLPSSHHAESAGAAERGTERSAREGS
jgi:glycerol-3-phosphate acyltransferase PlsX